MSAQQELIDRLRQHAASAPVISRQSIDMEAAADRLASLSAELEALREKLAGVDEKALEVAAKALDEYCRRGVWGSGASVQSEQEARAAIAAYLAAVRDKG